MLVEKSFHRLYSVPQVRYVKERKFTFRIPTERKNGDISILRVSKKPLFKRFAICNMLIIKCDFSGNNDKMTFLDIPQTREEIATNKPKQIATFSTFRDT
jgi:hypothetical protein